MNRLLLAALLAVFAAGCGKRAATAPGTAPDETPTPAVNEPAQPGGITLAEAAGARPIDKLPDYAIYLNIDSTGLVLLGPNDQFPEPTGANVTTLDNAAQVEVFLKRRAKQDRAAGPAKAPRVPPKGDGRPEDVIATTAEKEDELDPTKPPPPLRSTIIFRVDARLPFDKTYAVVKAARNAGYTKAQWRALLPNGAGEGHFAVTIPTPDDELALAIPDPTAPAVSRYVTRARADAAGKLADLNFNGIDLKADLDALGRKLRAVKQKHADKPVAVVIEIDGKLLHADVIRFVEECVKAGYPNAEIVPLDPKLR
jgi:biopolymer transport protein ExbD